MPAQALSAVSQVSFIEYSSPMPLVRKVLVCNQLVLPLQGLMAALSYTGNPVCPFTPDRIQTCPSGEKRRHVFSLVTGTLMAVFFSAAAGFLLFQHAYFFCFRNSEKSPQTAGLLRLTAVSIPLCAIHSCIDSYYYARKKSLLFGSRAAFGAVCPDRHYLYPVSDLSFRRTSDHCIDRSGWFPCRRDCRFAGVAAGSFLSFWKSPCTRKDSRQDLSADKGPFHTVFSHFPEQDPSDTSRQHRSGPDPTDASAFRHDSLKLTEDLWDLYRNGTAPAPVSFHTYVFRRCNADAFHRTA